jgi:hypothetical protein
MEPKITVEDQMREEVEILLPDGKVLRGPRNIAVEAFMKVYQDPKKPSIVGVIVNNDLRELTYPIKIDSVVKPVNMSDQDLPAFADIPFGSGIYGTLSRVVADH